MMQQFGKPPSRLFSGCGKFMVTQVKYEVVNSYGKLMELVK